MKQDISQIRRKMYVWTPVERFLKRHSIHFSKTHATFISKGEGRIPYINYYHNMPAFVFSVNGINFPMVFDTGSFGGAKLTKATAARIGLGRFPKGDEYKYDNGELRNLLWKGRVYSIISCANHLKRHRHI
ncbi:MAG: hypothetical protein WAM42_08485 [Candidatus Nitrosopolaris sp.]